MLVTFEKLFDAKAFLSGARRPRRCRSGRVFGDELPGVRERSDGPVARRSRCHLVVMVGTRLGASRLLRNSRAAVQSNSYDIDIDTDLDW